MRARRPGDRRRRLRRAGRAAISGARRASPRCGARWPPARRWCAARATSCSAAPRPGCWSGTRRGDRRGARPSAGPRAADRQALAGRAGGDAGAVPRPGSGRAARSRCWRCSTRPTEQLAGAGRAPGRRGSAPAAELVRATAPGSAVARCRCPSSTGPAVALRRRPGRAGRRAARRRPAGGRPDPRRPRAARPAHAGRRRARRRWRGRPPRARRRMSDAPLTLGTAGHIDHGKTALIRALTGVDTDRLPEERARGISIELGYAPLELPSGRRLSVIDVPGHERFVRTMVAGATGIDLFLMAIAADDGVMPQTREHAAVLRALGVDPRRRGGDQVRPGRPRAAPLARPPSCCPGARRSPVSARTGAGLDELRAALERAAAAVPSRAEHAGAGAAARRPRVHDPRGGHGGHRHAVVGRRSGRGRARAAARAAAGPGCAACRSTTQPVERARGRSAGGGQPDRRRGRPSVARGDVLAAPGRARADLPARRRARVRRCRTRGRGDRVQVHHGTRETPARLAWLGGRFWQLRLEQPLVAGGRRPAGRPPDRAAGHARRRRGARRPSAQARARAAR